MRCYLNWNRFQQNYTKKGLRKLDAAVNRACMEVKIKDNLPVMSGKVVNKNIKVLGDSGYKGVT